MQNVTDGRTMTEAELELHRYISNEIVGPEVMDPMESMNWEHGTPPTRDQLKPQDNPVETNPPSETPQPSDNPTVVEQPKETVPATPSINWDSYREANGLILGKYKTETEAIKGVSHAVAMAKSALTRAAEVEAESVRLRAELDNVHRTREIITPVTEKQTEVPSGRLDEILERIANDGLSSENAHELRNVLAETAEQTVERKLQERDNARNAEQAKWFEVDNYMRVKHPDALNHTDEIALFIKTNPLVDTAIGSMIAAGREKEAAELAWLQFDAARSAGTMATAETEKQAIQLDAGNQVRREAVEQARVDAGVQVTNAGGVHETPAVSTSREELERAAAEMRATGLGEKWRALAFGQYLDNPIFNK